MTDSNTNVGIEKLDKDNYQSWKFRMSNYLMVDKGLQGYVASEDKEPELPKEGATLDDLNTWKTWDERDKKVMFLILQNVSNGMIGHIQELTTSKEAWETLERLYMSKTKPRKIQLKNELNNKRAEKMKRHTLHFL